VKVNRLTSAGLTDCSCACYAKTGYNGAQSLSNVTVMLLLH